MALCKWINTEMIKETLPIPPGTFPFCVSPWIPNSNQMNFFSVFGFYLNQYREEWKKLRYQLTISKGHSYSMPVKVINTGKSKALPDIKYQKYVHQLKWFSRSLP